MTNTFSRWWAAFGLVAAIQSAHGQSGFKYAASNAFPTVTFSRPVCIATPPGETNRLFVLEQAGGIIVLTNLASPTRTVFMDLTNRVFWNGESGLLGLAFHPGYASNGYFYVYYTGWATNSGNIPNDILSRFQTSPPDANQADTNTETRFIIQVDRASNHNGGDLHFGPDGYLYVSIGDEGQFANFYHNAQHIDSNLFSGILRIDVDKRPGNLPPNPSPTSAVTTNYSIPQDNPFVGATSFDGLPVDPVNVRTEFWAVGLRNPWRFTFDISTGTMYCGDVGEDRFEEINIITKGGNYGWASYQGTDGPPASGSTNGQPAAQNAIFPIAVLRHEPADGSLAVIGGVVYRGDRFPQLTGAYVFGDYFIGNVWQLRYDGTNATPRQKLFGGGSEITTFGTDPRNGDILFGDLLLSNLKRIVSLTASFNSAQYSGGNLIARGTGPPTRNYVVLTSNNPGASWTPVLTNAFDPIGDFTFSVPIISGDATRFYRLQVP